jgi:hypothetical protein
VLVVVIIVVVLAVFLIGTVIAFNIYSHRYTYVNGEKKKNLEEPSEETRYSGDGR